MPFSVILPPAGGASSALSAHASTHQAGGSDALASVVSTYSVANYQGEVTLPAADIVRMTADGEKFVTGITAKPDGTVILLVNVSSYDITLYNESSSASSASNRISVPWSGNCSIAASGGSATIVYDGTSSRWRVV